MLKVVTLTASGCTTCIDPKNDCFTVKIKQL